jgi:hypothetical protein
MGVRSHPMPLQPGQVVVFPSDVRHWVPASRATSDPVSVAFDARWLPRTDGDRTR